MLTQAGDLSPATASEYLNGYHNQTFNIHFDISTPLKFEAFLHICILVCHNHDNS